MNYTKTILFVAFLAACITGCKDKEQPFLTIDEKKVDFLAEISSKTIQVQTNVKEWTAAVEPGAQAWLAATKQGTGLAILVSENVEMNVRKGNIIVSADGVTETIVVEQLGQAPAILVASATYTLPPEGGEINLNITSNIDYDIIVPADATWLTPKARPSNYPRVMISKEFAYQAGWNNLESERRAVITIKQKNGPVEKKITVVQRSQSGYTGVSANDIKDDIKVPVSSGSASSAQQGEGIEKSFDGDMNTLYHSAWNNSGANYFPITLNYLFTNQESIDYLIYYPRTGGNNGLFKEVEIWAATENNPSLTKIMDYDFKGSSSATKVQFAKPLVKPTAIRFVVKSGAGDNQGFASCAEMEFYRVNTENVDPLTLFTDLTCSQLKPGITLDDIEKVSNNLYRNIAYYQFKGTYPREFRIADYKAYPHPDVWANANKTSTMSLLDNPTGICVAENEDLVVFVGDTHGYTLSLKIQNLNKPGGDGYGNASYYPLSKGVNKLKTRSKGLIYVLYHTADYVSAPMVKIHFATGKVNGYFDSQKHSAADWSKYLNAAVDEYFDVLGKHAHITFPTEGFKKYAATNGDKLIDAYDDLVRMEKEFMGLTKYNRPTINRAYFHAIYTSYMYSTSYRTAYNVSSEDVKRAVLDVQQLKSSPWGPAHEQGHSFQTRPGFKWHGMTEVTNNVHSLWVQTQWGNSSRIETEGMGRYNNRYEKAYNSSFVKGTPHPGEGDVFCKLVSLWQLQLYFANALGNVDFYKDIYEQVRISSNKPTAGEQQLEFVKTACEIAKTDLTPFFKKWGYLSPFDKEIDDYGVNRFTITQQQIDNTIAAIKAKNYPVLSEKMEYICDSNWGIFKNHLQVQPGTATKSGANVKMTNWTNVVAYEVYEGTQLVFVTNRPAFTLDDSATANTKVYAIAYNGAKTEVIF